MLQVPTHVNRPAQWPERFSDARLTLQAFASDRERRLTFHEKGEVVVPSSEQLRAQIRSARYWIAELTVSHEAQITMIENGKLPPHPDA